MRFRAPSRGLALSAALLLSLTACNGGSPEDESTASPTTTAPASASDDTSSEGSGSESDGSDGAGSGEPSESEPAESSDADSTEAGGDGEYVPASEDGPAQNVPKPEMPEAMKEETEDGAKAAVQYWWDTVTYLQRTGDADLTKAASADVCDFCHSYSEGISDWYAEGGWHSGSEHTVTSALTGVLNKEKKVREVTVLLDMGASTTYKSDGTVDEEQSADARTDAPFITDVQYDTDAGHWRTTFVSFEGGEEQ